MSNTGNAQKYDFMRNQWSEIVKNGKFRLRHHILWMDDMNNICCGNNDGSYFVSLDFSEIEPKWTEIKDFPKVSISGMSLYEASI